MRHVRTLLAILLVSVMASPVGALAQEEEPYSGGDVTTTTLGPRITVVAEGLDVSFEAHGVGGECTWVFGDGATGEGNPVEHVYAADGTYEVTASCGADVITRSVTVAAALSFTGFATSSFLAIALILAVLGAGAVWFTRRSRTTS